MYSAPQCVDFAWPNNSEASTGNALIAVRNARGPKTRQKVSARSVRTKRCRAVDSQKCLVRHMWKSDRGLARVQISTPSFDLTVCKQLEARTRQSISTYTGDGQNTLTVCRGSLSHTFTGWPAQRHTAAMHQRVDEPPLVARRRVLSSVPCSM
jgi:transcriptional regulator of met regulon